MGFSGGSAVKNPPSIQEPQEIQFPSLGQEDLLEENMATHSSILAWRIPWTEEPGRLQSMKSKSGMTEPHIYYTAAPDYSPKKKKTPAPLMFSLSV